MFGGILVSALRDLARAADAAACAERAHLLALASADTPEMRAKSAALRAAVVHAVAQWQEAWASCSALQKVRDLQEELRVLRRVHLRPTSERAVTREAAQYANDCCFCNPAPGVDDAGTERWASRWLSQYEKKAAEQRAVPAGTS